MNIHIKRDKEEASKGINYSEREKREEQIEKLKAKVKKVDKCLRKKETKRRCLLIPLEKHERDFSKEMIKKIDIEEGREIYSERMKIVEPVFANIRIWILCEYNNIEILI